MKEVIGLQLRGAERLDDRQGGVGAVNFRNRDGAVEGDDRGRSDGEQLVVQTDDLPLVGS